jgi:hypothetical protein
MPSLAKNNLQLDPLVWGPHFWFFLHTVAISYPHHPNAVTKKKYYELIQNLPLFIPNEVIGSSFITILDEYPVTAYLDNRESLIKWMHFIHNKINEKLEKPKITMNEDVKMKDYYRWREKIIYTLVILSATGLIVYLFQK